MTLLQNEEFFKQVKGKKIRWSAWHDIYFIPSKLENDTLIGKVYYIFNDEPILDQFSMTNTRSYTIDKGFNFTIFPYTYVQYRWELIDPPIKVKYLISTKIKKK